MNSPAQDIADILTDEGVGVIGTSLFCFKQPTTPDSCITVIDSGGFPPEANYRYDYPTVQILVRGARNGYRAAYTVAENIKTTLNGKAGNAVDSTYSIIGIWAMGDILPLGNDESDRPLFSLNFRLQRQPT